MHILESKEYLMVQVHRKGLLESEDTKEQVQKVNGDVPGLVVKPLCRKNTPVDLAAKARRESEH